jgi:mono/diheme cytochrome c family protein
MAWGWLPDGSGGWLLVLALLAGAVGFGALARLRPATATSVIRGALVVAAVGVGLAVGARAVVQAANQPPPGSVAGTNPLPASADSIRRGEAIYMANCAACHGSLGDGDGPTAQRVGLSLDPLSERIPAITDGALVYRISVGTVGSGMPGFASTLSDGDRWDLVNYLRDAFGEASR